MSQKNRKVQVDMDKHYHLERLYYLVRDRDSLINAAKAIKTRHRPIESEQKVEIDKVLTGYREYDFDLGGVIGLNEIIHKLDIEIGKELERYPIWSEWLINLKGFGPTISAQLCELYYPRWDDICITCGRISTARTRRCKSCGKEAGEVIRIFSERDFPTVSTWWKYLGITIDIATGKKIQPKKGVVSSWSPRGRVLMWLIGNQAVRIMSSPYRPYYEAIKASKPESQTAGHKHAQARHEAAKLFAAHFWMVARTLDEKPVCLPYQFAILGHKTFIPPPVFDREIRFVSR